MKNKSKKHDSLFFLKKNEESDQTNSIPCFFLKKNEKMGQKI